MSFLSGLKCVCVRVVERLFWIINSALKQVGLRLIKTDNLPKDLPVIYSSDFVRVYTMSLFAAKARTLGLSGDCAEVGVYRGDFARHINKCFIERRVWLFDTFSGFVGDEIYTDRDNAYSEHDDANPRLFTDTSVDFVMTRMPYPENVRVCAGRFPQSAKACDASFCFVSIDVDLYAPIVNALEFFWPRLCVGGMIIVHDYNNARYRGVRHAVDGWSREERAVFVEIPDFGGSVVVIKPSP